MSPSPVIFHHGHGMKHRSGRGCGYGSCRSLYTIHGLSRRDLLDVAMCASDKALAVV